MLIKDRYCPTIFRVSFRLAISASVPGIKFTNATATSASDDKKEKIKLNAVVPMADDSSNVPPFTSPV